MRRRQERPGLAQQPQEPAVAEQQDEPVQQPGDLQEEHHLSSGQDQFGGAEPRLAGQGRPQP